MVAWRSFLWAVNDEPEWQELFWKTGTHTLTRPDWPNSSKRLKVDCFGIRFDPAGIDAILEDSGLFESSEMPIDPAAPPAAAGADAKPLPTGEAERVSKLILGIWGKSRDPFLKIFRAIRGEKKRGKSALNGK